MAALFSELTNNGPDDSFFNHHFTPSAPSLFHRINHPKAPGTWLGRQDLPHNVNWTKIGAEGLGLNLEDHFGHDAIISHIGRLPADGYVLWAISLLLLGSCTCIASMFDPPESSARRS